MKCDFIFHLFFCISNEIDEFNLISETCDVEQKRNEEDTEEIPLLVIYTYIHSITWWKLTFGGNGKMMIRKQTKPVFFVFSSIRFFFSFREFRNSLKRKRKRNTGTNPNIDKCVRLKAKSNGSKAYRLRMLLACQCWWPTATTTTK